MKARNFSPKRENENPRPLHRLGQNFLVDRGVLADIVARGDVRAGDVVLEVGPGRGILTRALLERGAAVHAVELDQRLRPELEALRDSPEAAGRLSLHWADALKVDYAALVPSPGKVIANIPYNITTPLIWRLIGFGLAYHLYMVQKEAAERLAAPADTKARYPLGVTLEVMGTVTQVRRVAPTCFRPVPKVESELVEIVIQKNHELARDPSWSELLHRAFAHRRKTLLNNLGRERTSPLFHFWAERLDEAGIDPKLRAEDLDGEAWLRLYRSSRGPVPPEAG